MKAFPFLTLLMVPALIWGALCDDTYYLNLVTQSTYAGGDPDNLARVNGKSVKPDLSDLDYLDSNMAYTVISKFEGSCAKAIKPITFRNKGVGKKVFADSLDNTYSVQMYDTNTRVEGGIVYDYWFGFYKPAATLRFPLGRINAKSEMFESWYVGVAYLDSVKNTTSGLWSVSSLMYPLVGPDDSLALEKRMVEATIGAIPLGENRKGHFKVQYIKVSYDSRPPNRISARPKATSGFQATQTGNLVLIRPGARGGQVPSEPLSLYGMMGNKVATLHPTGFVYQWNGRTSAGAEASTGVYFVQAGNRILGKFFYSR